MSKEFYRIPDYSRPMYHTYDTLSLTIINGCTLTSKRSDASNSVVRKTRYEQALVRVHGVKQIVDSILIFHPGGKLHPVVCRIGPFVSYRSTSIISQPTTNNNGIQALHDTKGGHVDIYRWIVCMI
jgi:hypothetical protein